MTLTASDISLLREFPASTEPPRGLTTDQRRRVEDLPWGLLRDGRRTDLGDDVIEMADRIAALEVEHAATLSASVKDVDVEEVLRLDREATPGPWRAVGASIRVTLPGGIEYQWATASYPRDTALMVNYRTAAPALAREVVALRAALATAEAERDELRLTLAAERGQAEGAPAGWEWTGGMWRRNGYPHAVTARHYGPTNLDQPWQWEVWDTRPAFDVRLIGKGYAPTARAAMIAADAALSGEVTTSPSALAPQGSQTPR